MTQAGLDLIRQLRDVEAYGMTAGVLPINWHTADGVYVTDGDGRDYLDFTSGIFTANIGHRNPRVLAALRDVLETQPLHTYTHPTSPRLCACLALQRYTGRDKVYLCSSGSEAVEAALRMARHYTGRQEVWSFVDSMHGKTLGAYQLSHGGPNVQRHTFPTDSVHICPRESQPAALILEPYQGWSGRFFPQNYLESLCVWVQSHGGLVISDEVQAGFGRTGRAFGYMHYNIKPDMLVLGKGMGGGMPISAVVGRADVLDSLADMSSTHSGNPLCCAALIATLHEINVKDLVVHAASFDSTRHAVSNKQVLLHFACFVAV